MQQWDKEGRLSFPRNKNGRIQRKRFLDENEGYDLTDLGSQFVHYAMSELPPKIEFKPEDDEKP